MASFLVTTYTLVVLHLSLEVVGQNLSKINVAAPGIFTFDASASLSFSGPGFDTGIARVAALYPEYEWSLEFVYDPKITNCLQSLTRVQDVLGYWYYKKRDDTQLQVMITPGCVEGSYLNQFAAMWDILLITSLAAEDSMKDRQRSPTWLTTTPYPPINEVYCSILAHFNWTKVYICVDRPSPGYYEYAAGRVVSQLTACGVQFTQFDSRSSEPGFSPRTMLKDFNSRSRVFIYFGQPDGLRKILIEASDQSLNMTNGEHVYLAVLPWRGTKIFGNFTWYTNDSDDEVVRRAYASIVLITLMDEGSSITETIMQEWKSLSVKKYNNTDMRNALALPNLIAIQAAVELAGIAIKEFYTAFGTDHQPSGTVLANMLMNRTFNLQVGKKHMTAFGHFSYDVKASSFANETGSFKDFLHAALTTTDQFTWIETARGEWFGQTHFPSNEPQCGFDGNGCSRTAASPPFIPAVTSIVLIVAIAITLYGSRRISQNAAVALALNDKWWQVLPSELIPLPLEKAGIRRRSSTMKADPESVSHVEWDSTSQKVELLRGIPVWVQKIKTSKLRKPDKPLLIFFGELKKIRQRRTISVMCGIVLLEQDVLFLHPYFNKGSLHDLIASVKSFEWEMLVSLISDLAQGVDYIHHSFLQVHGRLRSAVCLIDNRFGLSISETEYRQIIIRLTGREAPAVEPEVEAKLLLWTAPELLQDRSLKPSQKSDMYSLGVILQEIATWSAPYNDQIASDVNHILTSDRIADMVKEDKGGIMYRPYGVRHQSCSPGTSSVIESCWASNPDRRPSARTAFQQLQKFEKMERGTFAEKIMRQMERNARELEHLVDSRTQDLLEERTKCEALLCEILPSTVVQQLRNGIMTQPEVFESVTIYFSDVVGFVELASISDPMDVVAFLGELYIAFDTALSAYDVYKVETINDSYVVASGLPVKNEAGHAAELALMALQLMDVFSHAYSSNTVQLRVGMNSGTIVAGIVGHKSPRYCLFGDTMNTASRMESHGEPARIQVSESTAQFLAWNGCFQLSVRVPAINVKGKGQLVTYWLTRGATAPPIRSGGKPHRK